MTMQQATMKAVSKAANGISESLSNAGEHIVDFKDDAAKIMEKRLDMVGAFVKKHPFAAIGIGLGVGYLAARAIHRDW